MHKFLTMLAAALLMMFLAGEAQARRGFIPIPGSAEILVKVIDLPHKPEFMLKDGNHVDLGYKFNSYWQGGEWIGHIGSDSQYVSLTEVQIAAMLKAASLTTVPPVPSRPWTFVNSLWLAILGAIGIGAGLKMLRANGPAQPARAGKLQGGEADAAPADRAHAGLETLLREREARASGPAPQPARAAARGAPRAFGRRGA